MVDASAPVPKVDLTEQPRSAVTGAVFNRPLPTNALAAGAEQLGAGAEDLASNLAKQQAQQDLQNTKVTLDATGQPQVATPSNSIILGRAGDQYQAALAAGETSRIQTDVTGQLAQMHLDHAGDPQGFATAAQTYVSGLRSSTVYGPQVANQIADSAARIAEQHQANINEKAFELGTRTSLANIQTGIADTQNQMRVLARQGGMQTPDYDRLQDQLQDKYDQLKSNPLFGYAPDRADSELRTAMSTFQAEDTLGKVDATFKRTGGDGGRAGAQQMLDEQILNNPDLNLSDPERKQLYSYGMAHLQYLTSDQKAAIDANRLNVSKLTDALSSGKTVDPAVVNQALTQAKSLGDAESVFKIQAYAGQAHATAPYAGLTDEQRLRAMAGGGDYVTKVGMQEGGGRADPGGNGGGLFQFTAPTWATLSQQHPELNLTPDGRTDPAQSARAIVAFTNDNKAALTAAGIQPTDANTYMAHFLGASGATSFIKAMQADPSQPAAAINLKAATANPTIFYKNGDPSQPRSLSEVYALQTKRFGGGTTPVVSAASPGIPSQAQMQANPFAMTAYLDSLKSDGKSEIATAKNVGEALVTQFSQGNMPSAETVAAFNQVAAKHPEELGEIGQKVQTQMQGAALGAQAEGMSPAAGQAFIDNVHRLSQGQDLNVMASAEAAKKIYDSGVENLKKDPYGEAAKRGWIARPPMPLDFTQPQTIPAAIAEHGQAATALGSFTQNAAMPAFAPSEVPAIKSVMTSGTLDQRTGLLAAIAGGNMPEPVLRATLGQLAGSKETLPLAVAGSLYRDAPDAARNVIQGQALMQSDPKLAPNKDDFPTELAKAIPFNDMPQTKVREGIDGAVQAYYAKLSADANDTTGVLNDARMKASVEAVTGGVRAYRGANFIAPWYGASQYDTDSAIRSLSDADFKGAQTSDGKPFPADALKPSWSNALTWNNWRLQSQGDGKYLVFSGNDTNRQYLGNTSGGKFVLDLGSRRSAVQAAASGAASQSPFSSLPFASLPVGGPL